MPTCTGSSRLDGFWATVCKMVRSMLSDRCLSVGLSVTLVYCGQTVGRIKMKLGMQDFAGRPRPWPHRVRRRDSGPPPPKGHSHPIFGPCLLWPNGWMDQDATWYEDRPRLRPHCVTWGPSSPSQKGHSPRPSFRPMSTVAKRSPISATAEILLVLVLFRYFVLVCSSVVI